MGLGSHIDWNALFSMKDISAKTQLHLTKVYSLLMACTLACAFGMWVNASFVLNGFLMVILSMVCSIYLIYRISNRRDTENNRTLFLGAFAFFLGYLVGPGIHMIAEFQPKILMQALVYTACSFGSFSAISLFSKRRSLLFLGSTISSMISFMVLYQLIGWLTGSGHMNMVYMMFSLLLACLWVIYDTQVIIERAENGDKDVPTHTMMLFIDLFELFIKILRILMELSERKSDENNRRRRN
jgi:FtsH-binding integral membrane protein